MQPAIVENVAGQRVLRLTRPQTEEAENEAPTGRSMADLFAGRVGLVSGSGEVYSEDRGRRFAEHLAREHRQP